MDAAASIFSCFDQRLLISKSIVTIATWASFCVCSVFFLQIIAFFDSPLGAAAAQIPKRFDLAQFSSLQCCFINARAVDRSSIRCRLCHHHFSGLLSFKRLNHSPSVAASANRITTSKQVNLNREKPHLMNLIFTNPIISHARLYLNVVECLTYRTPMQELLKLHLQLPEVVELNVTNANSKAPCTSWVTWKSVERQSASTSTGCENSTFSMDSRSRSTHHDTDSHISRQMSSNIGSIKFTKTMETSIDKQDAFLDSSSNSVQLLQLTDTIEFLKQLLPQYKINPIAEMSIRLIDLSTAQVDNKQFGEALRSLTLALNTVPLNTGIVGAHILTNMCFAHLMLKQNELALQMAQSAVKRAIDYPNAWRQLGDAFRCNHKFWKALKVYEIALYLDVSLSDELFVLMKSLKRAVEGGLHGISSLKSFSNDTISTTLKLPTGFVVNGNDPSMGGCYIAYVIQDSNADKSKLLPGDQLISIGNASLVGKSIEDCLELLAKASEEAKKLGVVDIAVFRGNVMELYGLAAYKLNMQSRLINTSNMDKENSLELLL